MIARYTFEEELLDAGYDFEPHQEGYCIDDLKEEDRAMLGGMLYTFFHILPAWKLRLSETYEPFGLVGQIFNECLEESYKVLLADFTRDVREFVVDCLDEYETEEDEDGNA